MQPRSSWISRFTQRPDAGPRLVLAFVLAVAVLFTAGMNPTLGGWTSKITNSKNTAGAGKWMGCLESMIATAQTLPPYFVYKLGNTPGTDWIPNQVPSQWTQYASNVHGANNTHYAKESSDFPCNPAAPIAPNPAGQTVPTSLSFQSGTYNFVYMRQRVETTNLPDNSYGQGPSSFSAETWFKSTGLQQYGQALMGFYTYDLSANVAGNRPRWAVTITPQGKLAFRALDVNASSPFKTTDFQSIETPGSVSDSKWHHMGVTRDGTTGTMKMYLDGALVGSVTPPSSFTYDTRNGHFRFGCSYYNWYPVAPGSNTLTCLTGNIAFGAAYQGVMTDKDFFNHWDARKYQAYAVG